MSFVAGVDVGSSNAKAVVLDAAGEVVGRGVAATGLDLTSAAQRALEAACNAGRASGASSGGSLGGLAVVVTTGYGRDDLPGSLASKSEVACLARAAHFLLGRRSAAPSQAATDNPLRRSEGTRMVVDIGAQDNKVVWVDQYGQRKDYRLNRRCAAGTGAFIELICLRMGISLQDLNALALQADQCAPLNSFCSVFAATEVLDLLRRGYSAAAIAKGVYRSVAQRVADMGAKGSAIALSGGVAAHHPAMLLALEEVTGADVIALEYPQHVGALGAALFARASVLSDQPHLQEDPA